MNKLTISDYLPISGRRICSIGNRGHHNFGDELILLGLMKLLLKSESDGVYISGGDLLFLKKFHTYFFTSEDLKKISYLQEIPHGFRSFWKFITYSGSYPDFTLGIFRIFDYLSCDAFIVGGGELFTEETPGSYLYRFRSLLPYRIRKIFFWNTKLYLMGGFQKPVSRYNRAIARLITKCADGCYMRDQESVQDILAIHPRKKHVEWFIDTSYFAMEQAKRLKGERAKMREVDEGRPLDSEATDSYLASGGQRSHIIINSNPLSGKRTDELVSIAKDYMHRGYDVYFLPAFFTSNPQQDDMKVYEYLINKVVGTHGNVSASKLKLLDRRNRDEFLIMFHSAEKIFCSRLHVFLIAAFLGLDVQAYPYQKKIAKNMSILKQCSILK